MKAIVYRRNGPPDVLSCEEIEKPTPNAQEVLIKVRAAAVNPLDCHLLKGGPAVMRMLPGRGKLRQPGVDVAGVVEAVGSGVTEFTAGDAVFVACRGAFAEYAIAPVSALASKPETVSFEDAAASPIAALTALQGLRDKGKIQAGQHVLINGASGGVGTFGVQLAKIFGAHVTGVCSAHNAELVRSQARLDSARNSRWDGNPGRAAVPVGAVSGLDLDDYSRMVLARKICRVCCERKSRRLGIDWRTTGERPVEVHHRTEVQAQ